MLSAVKKLILLNKKIHVLPQTIIDHIGRNKTLDTSKNLDTGAMYGTNKNCQQVKTDS